MALDQISNVVYLRASGLRNEKEARQQFLCKLNFHEKNLDRFIKTYHFYLKYFRGTNNLVHLHENQVFYEIE